MTINFNYNSLEYHASFINKVIASIIVTLKRHRDEMSAYGSSTIRPDSFPRDGHDDRDIPVIFLY